MTTRSSSSSLSIHRARTRTFRVAAALVLLGLAGEGWYLHLNAAPQVTIPPLAPMPNPNLYDDLVRLSAKKVEPRYDIWKPTSQIDVDPLPAANAPLRLPLPTDPPPKMVMHVNTDGDRQEALAKAEPVLTELRTDMAAHDYRAPSQRELGSNHLDLGKIRSLAKTLAFESQMRERTGDYAGAAGSALDAIQLGVIVPKSGDFTARLVGMAIETIGQQRLGGLVDRLDAAQSAAIARRLETIEALRSSMADNLTEEKWSLAAQTREFLAHRTTLQAYNELHTGTEAMSQSINSMMGEVPDEPSLAQKLATKAEAFHAWGELLTHSKQNILDDEMRMMDTAIAASQRPFSAPQLPLAEAHDPINRYYFMVQSMYRIGVLKDAETRVKVRLLSLAFALHAYRLQNGAYPERLDSLQQSHLLSRIPDDPFAPTAGVPLHYQRTGVDRFLLYSVGPDGVDNGGKPIVATYGSGKPRSVVEPNDQGDWVYGINTPKPAVQP